jgi:hypothetical protein
MSTSHRIKMQDAPLTAASIARSVIGKTNNY